MSKYKLFHFLLVSTILLLVSCSEDGIGSPSNNFTNPTSTPNITVSFSLGNDPLEIKTHLGDVIFSSNITIPYGQNVGNYLDNFVSDTSTKLTANLPVGATISPTISSVSGSSLTNAQTFTVTHNGNTYSYRVKLSYQVVPKPLITVNFKLGNNLMVVTTNGSTPVFSSNITIPYGQNVGNHLDKFVSDTSTKLTADLPVGATISPAISSVSGSSLTNAQTFTVTHNSNTYPYQVKLSYQVAPKPLITVNFKLGNNLMVVTTNGSTPIFNSNITILYGQNVGNYLDNFVSDTSTKLTADLPVGATISPTISNVSGSSLTNAQTFTVTHNGNTYSYQVKLTYQIASVDFKLGNNLMSVATNGSTPVFNSNITILYGQNVGNYLDNFVSDTSTKLTANLPVGATISPAISSVSGSSLTNAQTFTVTHNGNTYSYQVKLTYQIASVDFKLGNNLMSVATNGSTPIFNSNINVPFGENIGAYLDNFVTDTATKLTANLPVGATISPAISSVSGSSLTNTQTFTITHNGNLYPYEVELAYTYCGVEKYKNQEYTTAGTEVAYNGKIYKNKWHANLNEEPESSNTWEFVRNCDTSDNLNNGNIGATPTTYCGVEAYEDKAYATTGTEVFYQNKIYRNKWYMNAGETPGVNGGWEFIKDCNNP